MAKWMSDSHSTPLKTPAVSTYLTLFRQNFLEFFDQILIPPALIRVGEFRPKCLIVAYKCLIGKLHLK